MKHVWVLLTLVLLACKSYGYELSPDGRVVRLMFLDSSLLRSINENSQKPTSVFSNCKYRGPLVSHGMIRETSENDLRNQTAELGGNLVFSDRVLGYEHKGIAYRCDNLDAVIAAQANLDTKTRAAADQEAQTRQKARQRTGLNLDALEKTIDRWLVLPREALALHRAEQTIKAKKKQIEVDQAWREIDGIFSAGKSISASPDCVFEKVANRVGEISLFGGARQFRLHCFDKKLLQEGVEPDGPGNNTRTYRHFLDLIFEFEATADNKNRLRPDWTTSNDIAEQFESGVSSFTGSAQIVGCDNGAWNCPQRLKKYPVVLFLGDADGGDMYFVIRVKLQALQPVN